MKDILPENVLDSVRADYEAHDKSCISLRYMWFARHGGVSCPSDIGDCVDCGATFYNEGLSWLNYDASDDEDEMYVCGCCALKIGVELKDTGHYVTRVKEEL